MCRASGRCNHTAPDDVAQNTVSGRREKRITSSKVLEASRLGEQLAYVSARKVVMIIIILSAVLPFYVDEDSHVLAQRVGMLQLSLQGSRGATRQQLSSSLVALSQPEEFDVLFLRVNGTVLVDNPAERARLRCEELSQVSIATESGGEDLGVFGNENVLNSRSVFNIVYICLVLLVLMVSTVLFNRDTRKYVVKPMMRVIKVINELRTRVAETVLSFDETGWDPAHVERTVYDMALWIETQQARNLLPTSEEKRLEALQRAQRRAEERQSAAAAAAAAAASRSSTPTRGGSMSKSPPSVSGGTGSVAARGRPAAGGGSMVLFGSKKHDGGGSDIRRQKSEQHTRTAAGAGIGGSTIFSTARDGLRRLWREARGVDSDDEDVLEQEPSPTDSPMPSPRHSSVVSDAGHTVMSAPAGGSFTLRRRRSMSAGAASEARRQASRRSKRHIVEEIPLPLVQHAAEQSAGGRTESGMARSGGGGSLILSSKPSLRSMVVQHNSTTPSRGVTTAPALSSPGDNVHNPAGQQPYTPVTPLQAGAGASPRLPPAVPGGGSIVLYSDGSYALESPAANTAASSVHLGPVAVPVQMAGAVSASDGDTKHSPQRGGGRQAADAGSVASSSQGGSRSGTTILQVALAGGRMGDARTQRALAGSPGGVVAHGRYGRRGSIDHRLLNQFYSQRLAEMQSGRMVSPASAQGGDGGSSVLSHHSRGGRSSSTRSASRGGQEALQPRPQQPLGGSLLMEPSRLRDLSGTSSGGKSSASSKPTNGRGDASADGSHAGHASDATHITPLSDDDEVPDTLNTSANRKAAPIGTSSLVLFSQRQLQEGAAKPPLAPHTQPRNMRSGRKRTGSSNASDEHDIAKYYTSEEGGEGGGEIEHGDSYGSMAGYLQEESIPHSTQGGVGPVQELGGTDDLDAYLQAEGVASVGSDEDEVHVTLDDEGEGTHYSVLAPTGLSVATGPPAAAAAGGAAEAAAEWRSPWSLTADEEAAVEAAQTARYREALKEVMKSAARRGEDLGSAIDRKQRKGGGR